MHQRQLRGNLPQAFGHAGLLECAVALSENAPQRRRLPYPRYLVDLTV